MERISSRQNSVARRFRALVQAGATDDDILLDGPHLLGEALDAGIAVEVAAFAESAAPNLTVVIERATAAEVRTIVTGDALFRALSPVREPSGVVSIARRPAASLDAALARSPQLLLLLDGVQDPGNVGAIVRAAEACGATALLVGAGSADPFGWKALRGAMGSSLRLPIVRTDLHEALRRVRSSNVRVVATVPRSGKPPSEADLRSPVAILLGGEGAGIPDALVAAADERITIPMRPPVESLNVSIAAALVLYEASRQRTHVAV